LIQDGIIDNYCAMCCRLLFLLAIVMYVRRITAHVDW